VIFHKLGIEDFGVFNGSHEFILTPHHTKQHSKPITLIGGENGAGKTTWLEAILLCLFGKEVLRLAGKNVDYGTYLRSRIHKPSSCVLPPTAATVSLEFDHVQAGKVDRYRIRREIQAAGEKAREKLFVYRNDQLVDDLSSEYWQDFLRELVPPGLCGLFFFDGEKIQRLVDDELWEVEARGAIESLLGLDIVDRLKADLVIFETKSIDQPGTEMVRADLDRVQREKQELTESVKISSSRIAELDRILHDIDGRIMHQQQTVMQHGGAYATQRVSLEGEQRRYQREPERIRDEIRDLCAGALPIALVPDLCESLKARLAAEAELGAWLSAERILQRAIQEEITGDNDVRVVQALHQVERRLARPESLRNVRSIHNLSYLDSTRTLGMLDEVSRTAVANARRLHNSHERAHRAMQRVLLQLNRVPSDEVLQPLVRDLSALHEEKGRASRERDQAIENERISSFRLEALAKEESRLLSTLEEVANSEDRVRTVAGIRRALDSYRTRLLGDRLRRLASEICELFNQLARKRNLLHAVSINPESFAFTLQRGSRDTIRRDQLSAGERQLFAIALLWSLARVSGRPLPVIVDTPLGRLDSAHRGNLVTRYFPRASHQVILLSTDTEVDRHFFKELSSSIAQVYRLRFDDVTGGTTVESGYFWNKPKAPAYAR